MDTALCKCCVCLFPPPSVGVQAFNTWLQVPDDKKEEIQVVTQMLHNASLMYVVMV